MVEWVGSGVTCLMLIRRQGLNQLRAMALYHLRSPDVRRVQYGLCVNLHYTPLRSTRRYRSSDGIPVEADGGYVAVVVHPSIVEWAVFATTSMVKDA